MKPRGKPNVFSALTQTKPPLIKLMNKNNYCWNDEYDSKMLLPEIVSIIEVNYKERISTTPNDDEINKMASSTLW